MAGIGGAFLQLVAAVVIAAIVMAHGEAAIGASRAIFERVAGTVGAIAYTTLSSSSKRASQSWR